MTVRDLPKSPEELDTELERIFPGYSTSTYPPVHDDTPSFHSVLLGFAPYLGGRLDSFTPEQLREFGELVNAAVAGGGTLENAFGTCLLEHLHQIRASSVLRPHLSKLARSRMRA